MHVPYARYRNDWCLWLSGDPKVAEERFKDCLRLDPKHIIGSLRYGVMLLGMRRLQEAEPLLQFAALNADQGPVKEAAKKAYRALGIMQNRSTGGKGQNPSRVAERLRLLDKMKSADCTTHTAMADELDEIYKESQGQRNTAERDSFCDQLLKLKQNIPKDSPPEARLEELLDICYIKECCARDTIRMAEELSIVTKTMPEAEMLEEISSHIRHVDVHVCVSSRLCFLVLYCFTTILLANFVT